MSAAAEQRDRVVRLNESFRVAKILGLQGFSQVVEGGRGEINDVFLYNAVATFLASKHFNERSGDILSELPSLLGGCDLYWSYEYRDGQQQNLEAARQLLAAFGSGRGDVHHPRRQEERDMKVFHIITPPPSQAPSSLQELLESQGIEAGNYHSAMGMPEVRHVTHDLEPMGVYGAYWSRVSKTNLAMTAALETPYITAGTTSAELAGSPLFARTSPDNNGDARAAMVYYKNMGISHVAVLFIKDSWGINYHAGLTRYANEFGVTTVASFAYDTDSIERTIADLQKAGYRHIFAIMHSWRDVIRVAYDYGIVGQPGYVWIAAEGGKWTSESFQLDAIVDEDLARALHGIGTLNIYVEPFPAFDEAMKEFASNSTLQREFVDIHANADIFDNYTFPEYAPNGFSEAAYDAIISLGVAACNASNNLPDQFSGPELYDVLRKTDFLGVSGHVQFDPITGSRLPQNVRYSIEYVTRSEERSDMYFERFDSNIVAIVLDDNLTSLYPFVYNDGTTNLPAALPPIADVELHLLSGGAQAVGFCLAGLVMLCSVVCFAWTLRNKEKYIVRAGQPYFLCQLCVGAFVMCSAVFPWSLPLSTPIHTHAERINDDHWSDVENTSGLDAACLSHLWLIAVGFSIGSSALASKSWRLRKLLKSGANMRRVEIKISECMHPLYVSLTVNIGLMSCITGLSPLRYERVLMDDYDSFGRSVESYGGCKPASDKFYLFGGALLILNFLGVLLVAREAYKSRNAPADFTDAYFLSLAMLSLLEILILGGPILLLAGETPTTLFLVGSSLMATGCLTILLFLFLPKYMGRNLRHGMRSIANSMNQSTARERTRRQHTSSVTTSVRTSVRGPPPGLLELQAPLDLETEPTKENRETGKMYITRTAPRQ
ncbi:Gamma-aminobutyric acid (GABA) B receptor [Seminavis robusta]|uniref:Gamma-aminobutyric acid (GABA) B receptor n=1 Tax=Seminavis robusta TaxID=568900 RepID=A0A9N8HSI0_9STRA|nr:Gamma-aminobutyric acid (GABA) B receptor [Seminavis robusta]|eukprot:Sro1724_g293730.1 Gamma-aminobutyric acid (GABA) B receptor (889) ;mRNA; r:19393-22059